MTLYGRTIDAYYIGRLLGRGSFGDVYEARCQHSGQLVAVKMISKELLHNQGLLDRIAREVEIHCQLQHPHIVELYEYFEDDRRVYLVMELCKNGELLALLRKHGRFDASTTRTFFSQLVDGVAYLHNHSILHRDLKLSNLLLTSNNTLKIADFGLAAAIGANDPERRTICGTPNYMCPEIVEQQPYSLGADLWSLGVTLYTLLTGTPPFQSDAVRGTLQRVGCADYLLPRQLPAEAADLISHLLQKDPARRLSLSGIQSHPFLTGRPRSLPPSTERFLPSDATNSNRRSPSPKGVPRTGQNNPSEKLSEQHTNGDLWQDKSTGRPPSRSSSNGSRGAKMSCQGTPQEVGLAQSRRSEVPGGASRRQEPLQVGRERHVSRGRASEGAVEEPILDGGLGRVPWESSTSERSHSRVFEPQQTRVLPEQPKHSERRSDSDSDSRSRDNGSRSGTATSERGAPDPHPQLGNLTPPSPAQLPTRPLSTLRLKALRHETSYGSLAILEDGRVQVRITGPGESVITVSGDGLEVEAEQPGRPKKGYRFPALPDALLMHYAHAAAFVGTVASATPKVVYLFERGQATCMENGDLQVCFTDSSPAPLLHVHAASGKCAPQVGFAKGGSGGHCRPNFCASTRPQVERAAELVAAVQGLHASLLPANVSVASAQELSFASSSSSSHLERGLGLLSQPKLVQGPFLKQGLSRSPSSPLSPNPSLYSETPSVRDGSSLQPFELDGRPLISEHVAVAKESGRSSNSHQLASFEEEPVLPGRGGQLERGGTERGAGSRGLDDAIFHVGVYEEADLRAAEAPAARSNGVQTSAVLQRTRKPPRPSREETEERNDLCGGTGSARLQGDNRAATRGGGTSGVIIGGDREAGNVLADLSNRQLLEAQNARRMERAKGLAGDRLGGCNGAQRRGGAVGSGPERVRAVEERVPVVKESFKVFEDREEPRPRAGALLRPAEKARNMDPQDRFERNVDKNHLRSYEEPVVERKADRLRSERRKQTLLPLDPPSEPPSTKSFSETWQDLSGASREPPDMPATDTWQDLSGPKRVRPNRPVSDTWGESSGTKRDRLVLPSASPSSDTWQDGRSEDPLPEGLAIPSRHKQREDARSYVASNHLVTTNREPSSQPPAPFPGVFSYGSLSSSPPPDSQFHRTSSDVVKGQLRSEPTRATRSSSNPTETAPRDLRNTERRPEKGADGENGRQSAYFPGVGWAIRLKSGELLMHYLDDCQMVVANDGATVEFWPPGAKMGGSKYKLSDRKSIPQEVRDKLQHLSAFIKLIRKQSHSSTEGYAKWVTPRTSPALTGQ